jgi:peroxiredoxin
MRRMLAVMLLVLMVLAAGCQVRPTRPRSEPLTVAPDFVLRDIEGHEIRLSQLARGGPVLLNFWASWCRPCVQELPELEKLHREFSAKGLTVVGVNLDHRPESARALLGRLPVTFIVLLDTEEKVATAYGVTAIPRSLVVNRELRVLADETGYSAAGIARLRAAVQEALDDD